MGDVKNERGARDENASGTTHDRLDDAYETARIHDLLVNSVRDYAVFALDPTGHVLTWNAGAAAIKGYTAREIIGQHFSRFYPPADIASGKPEYELEEALRAGRVEDEGWRVRKDGTHFWANVVITTLVEAGEVVGFAKITRDLTERRMAEERARADARRVGEVEMANRAKSEFLTSMSHELRTPLNAIAGYTDLLLLGVHGPLTDDQRRDAERIRLSQRHLLGIINDLLNFTRVETGHVNYRLTDFATTDMIQTVIPMVLPQANASRLGLDVIAAPEPVIVRADRTKAEQVLLNLLSNAVKFTNPGGSISIRTERHDSTISISVEDTGSGILAEYLESIFEPFVQVGRSLTTGHEGTGLGLAISRDLARAMGGDLTVSSTPGRGSTFTFSLPASANAIQS